VATPRSILFLRHILDAMKQVSMTAHQNVVPKKKTCIAKLGIDLDAVKKACMQVSCRTLVGQARP
jgi:hypothetical protein